MRPSALTPNDRRVQALLAWILVAACPGRAEEIQVRDFQHRVTIRAMAFAEKAETIVNTLRWPQIKYLIPDGAYVNEGDLLTEFDPDEIENDLRDLKFAQAEIEADLARNLTDLRNKDMKLRDDLAALRDRLEVLNARRARLRGLPDPDEVKILEGKARVAELEAVAASNDMVKAQNRFERKMISPTEQEEASRKLRQQTARWEAARKRLDYARLPATALAIERLDLEQANVRMEIDKLEHEIRENEAISAIRKEGASAQKEIIERNIGEKEAELQKTKVRAPISGHVIHLKAFKDRVLRSGSKLWKNFGFLRMPDDRTLAFKGLLLESDRKFFAAGDKALLQVIGGPPEALEGQIASISALPHDIAEKEESGWGTPKQKGIVVFDVVLKPNRANAQLRSGMHALCELFSSRTITGPSVPVTYLKTKNADYYLSFGGVYRRVSGKVIQGYFVLDDASLAGRSVDFYGRFPDEQRKTDAETLSGFRAIGELVSTETTPVTANAIYGSPKITWIVDEDTVVRTNDVLIRLDEAEVREEIRDRESRLKEAQSAREALEEQVKLKEREGQFQLAREKNLLRIAEIDYITAVEDRNWPAIFDAELALREAEIRLEAIESRVRRTEGNDLTSPAQRERMKRDRERARLQKEAAEIRLDVLKRGADPLVRKRAQIAYIERKLRVESMAKRIETDQFRASREIQNAKISEEFAKKYLRQREESLADHTIRSPADGLVQYGKVWSGGSLAKPAVGTVISPGAIPMKIANVSRLHVRAEIPEEYYTRVYKGLPVHVAIPSLTDAMLSGIVTNIEFLFETKRRKDTEIGLYSSQEPLGETVFYAHIEVKEPEGLQLKPGAVTQVWFPFRKIVPHQEP